VRDAAAARLIPNHTSQMPIYDYLCTECDHRADILHGINDPGPNFCPSCGREGTMKKQFSTPAIHFKGSGWAKKDRGSSSSGTKAAHASSDKAEARPDHKGEHTSDLTGEPKHESKDPAAGSSSSASSGAGSAPSAD
jgi:putative FmdB family regulatory protein